MKRISRRAMVGAAASSVSLSLRGSMGGGATTDGGNISLDRSQLSCFWPQHPQWQACMVSVSINRQRSSSGGDPIFLSLKPGGKAFQRDLPKAESHMYARRRALCHGHKTAEGRDLTSSFLG